MVTLGQNRYGKSRVRLVRVRRKPQEHEFREWNVQALLHGDFEACFTGGDNSKILPTDTMKNTVYSLARNSSAQCIEEFAKELVAFLLGGNPQVSIAEVSIAEVAWEHAAIDGEPHPTTFVQSSAERQTTHVSKAQRGDFTVVSGLDDLVIMKTADSAFTGYIRDSLTTLPETRDRLFGTAMRAEWTYSRDGLPFAMLRQKIRQALLAAFAGHKSESVQHTLYAMAQAALDATPEINDLNLVMPNKHCLLVDLSRFGQDNPNEIFVPIDEPHGYIEARIARKG